eukprot:scaffold224_cov276-Chaetoceros_neogracile.AAC.61
MKINVDSENVPPKYSPVTALSPKAANFANRFSPNNNNNNNFNDSHNNNSNDRTDKDEIFQLQIEIQSLKNRLKLSSSTEKNELIELNSEKDTVIATKSKQISALNDKFHKITRAVSQMEKEVKLLRKDNATYQEDAKKLKRYLNIREKEVTALVTRCTAQEEKLAESKSSRMLEKQLKELQLNFHSSQEQLKQLHSLQETLVECEAERDAAVNKVDQLFVQNKDLSQHIVDTKEQLELQRESRDASAQKMKEQMEDIVGLKEEQEKKCDSLSIKLKECDGQMLKMERTIQDMRKAHQDEIILMQETYTEHNSKANKLQQATVEALTIAKDNEIMELKRQLKDGDEVMAAVLKDVAVLNQENKEVKQELNVIFMGKNELIEDQRKVNESHTKEKSVLSTLAETQTKDIELLNEAMQKLKDDNSLTTGHASKLNEHIRSLEDQISALTAREGVLVKADLIAKQTMQRLEVDLQDMEMVRSTRVEPRGLFNV